MNNKEIKGKLIKQAYNAAINDPLLRVPIAAALGGILGGAHGYSEGMVGATEEEKRQRATSEALRGAMLGGGIGALPEIFGVEI